MATFNIVCGGPGPHIPASGILGTSDRAPTADVRCSSPACAKPDDPTVVNQRTLQDQATAALVSNRTYAALASPTNAQVVAATQAQARQLNGIIRLLLGQLDATN